MIAAILAGALGIMLANEYCDLAPWCACKLARWSAFRRYTNPARAEARAEELAALINARPGNILKLGTATCFAAGALTTTACRLLTRQRADIGTNPVPALHAHTHDALCSEVLERLYTYLDGDIDNQGYEQIREHLNECGPCLREYGLEEAVKRLVHRCCGEEAAPSELRVKMMSRIRAELGITQEQLNSQDHRPR